jgi:cyclopropane-fatty-acyl-phospholipid synthase
MNLTALAERGWIPDSLVRSGIQRLLNKRLKAETEKTDEAQGERLRAFVAELDASPIAIETDSANAQHYEVPAQFFKLHLGPRLKYSCCLFATGRENLAGAEEAMLATYVDRAQIVDGHRILDLGCGWGSFALWAAARYPQSTVVALSNSQSQREHIEGVARERGIGNLVVRTGNVVDHEFSAEDVGGGFDRIVSIEMFEHMKNYRKLFAKVSRWLKDDGRVFLHVFANRQLAYHFVDEGADDWMTRHFFSGGTMPSFDLFKTFDDDLVVEKRWWVSGRHYERTAEDWLRRMDFKRDDILRLFETTYGEDQAERWFARWRMFYMAVAEMFGFDEGRQWGVGHYRLAKRDLVDFADA